MSKLITALHKKILAGWSDGKLGLHKKVWGEDLAKLLKGAFDIETLNLLVAKKEAIVLATDSKHLLIQGKLKDQLGFDQAAIEVLITLSEKSDDNARLNIKCKQDTGFWMIGKALPSLKEDSIPTLLPLTNTTLIYTSEKGDLPEWEKKALPKGISLRMDMETSATGSPDELLGGRLPDMKLTGQVKPGKDSIDIQFVSKGVLDFEINLMDQNMLAITSSSFSYQRYNTKGPDDSELQEGFEYLDLLQLEGTLKMGETIELPFLLQFSNVNPIWEFRLFDVGTNVMLPVLKFLGAKDGMDTLPDAWLPLESIKIPEISLGYHTSGEQLDIMVMLLIEQNNTWDSIPLLNNIESLRARLSMQLVKHHNQRVRMAMQAMFGARVKIQEVPMEILVRVGGNGYWEIQVLQDDASNLLSLLGDQALEDLFPSSEPPQVVLNKVALGLDTTSSKGKIVHTLVDLEIKKKWHIIPKALALEDVRMMVRVDNPANKPAFFGHFEGKILLGDQTIDDDEDTDGQEEDALDKRFIIPIRARKNGPREGWQFDMGHTQAIRIPGLPSILQLAGTDEGVIDALPAALSTMPDFWLADLYVQFQPGDHAFKQMSFRFGQEKTEHAWIIIGNEEKPWFSIMALLLELTVKKEKEKLGLTGTISGQVAVGKRFIPVKANRKEVNKGWHITIATKQAIQLPSTEKIFELFGAQEAYETLPHFAQKFPGINIQDIDIQLPADKKKPDSSFAFKTSLPDAWELTEHVTIKTAAFDYKRTVKQEEDEKKVTFDATLNSTLTFGKKADPEDEDAQPELVDITIKVEHSAKDKCWKLSLSSKKDQQIHLLDLTHHVAKLLVQAVGQDMEDWLPPRENLDVTCSNLSVTYNTGKEKKLHFGADVKLTGKAMEGIKMDKVDFKLKLDTSIKDDKRQWEGGIIGNIEFVKRGKLSLELKFGKKASLGGIWKAEEGQGLRLSEVIQLANVQQETPPDGFDFELVELSTTYNFKEKSFHFKALTASKVSALLGTAVGDGDKRGFLFSVYIDKGFTMPQIPVVSDHLHVALSPFHLQLASNGFKKETFPKPDDTVIQRGLRIATELDVKFEHLEFNKAIDLQIGGEKEKEQTEETEATDTKKEPAKTTGKEAPNEALKKSGQPEAGSEMVGAASSQNAKWIKIHKEIGPLNIHRVGLEYASPQVWLLLDAGISLAGLTVDLMGLAFAFSPEKLLAITGGDFSGLKPEAVRLNGLSIAFSNDVLTISGALLRTGPHAYAGSLMLRVNDIMLSAIGAYEQEPEQPASFFLYAVLRVPIGGPPFFFVMGFAAGLGINRQLNLPPIEKVDQFSLVRWAKPGKGPKAGASASEVLQQMGDDITVAQGQQWLAAGILFTSFKLIDAFALLTVSWGTRTEIALLGMATIEAPTGKGVDPLVSAGLAIKATFLPESGVLAVQANLTSNSYVFSKDCRLSGGFAFYTWFETGDFVVSLGGYHPDFNKPAHYPSVPRLSLNWDLSKYHVSIKGFAYMALTPSFIMAGGGLEVKYEHDGVKAWFTAVAHFLLGWKPFYYSIFIKLSVGAEVKFLGATLSFSLGASVRLWGPEFAGEIELDLSIFTITIYLGEGRPVKKAISFQEFLDSFLPQKENIININPNEGLIRELQSPEASEAQKSKAPLWQLHPSDAQLSIRSAMPIKRLKFNGRIVPTEQGTHTLGKTEAILQKNTNDDWGIAPSNIVAKQLSSECEITFKDLDRNSNYNEVRIHLTHGAMPKSMFGIFDDQNLRAKSSLIPDGLNGIIIEPLEVEPEATAEQDLAELIDSHIPSRSMERTTITAPAALSSGMRSLASNIESVKVTRARHDLIAAMNEHGGFNLPEATRLQHLTEDLGFPLMAKPVESSLGFESFQDHS